MASAFPEPERMAELDALERAAEAVDAELACFHSVVPDPATLPAPLRPRIGGGCFVPGNPLVHCNDVEHWRRLAPFRFDALVAAWCAATGMSAAGVIVHPGFQAAASHARWMQAWSADVVVGHGLGEAALRGMVAAALLGVPRLVRCDRLDDGEPYAPLLPLLFADADAVVVPDDTVRRGLLARVPVLADRVHVLATEPHGMAPVLRELLARRPAAAAPPRGPHAAFVGPVAAPATPVAPGARGFVVCGAERTGSNLLVGMLARVPGLACAGELFNPLLVQSGRLPWLGEVDPDRAELRQLRLARPASLLQRLRSEAADAGAVAVGCKVLYHHELVDQRVTDALVADPDLAVIHLVRADRLQRFLSHDLARRSDRWFASALGPSPTVPVGPRRLDIAAVLADFAEHELLEERHRAVFAAHRRLELVYEQFVADMSSAARGLGTLLDVRIDALTPRSARTVTTDGDVPENLEDVRAALRSTRWAALADPAGGRA
ncbi:MAG: hypothetical protein JNK15_09780 [Planctomycetes bacterium]|nr:hypothetical protein [Planctomycetota bacterium]